MNLFCTEQVFTNDWDTTLVSVHHHQQQHQEQGEQQHHQQQQQQQHHQQQQQNHMENRINTASPDPIFLHDRCLENLLIAEKHTTNDKNICYFNGKRDITWEMRKIVAEWMMEVSEFY